MENGFLNSLDVSSLSDEIRKEEAAAPNPFAGFAEEVQREELATVGAAARWSKQFDPEAYAKAQKLAPDLPVETAVRGLKDIEAQERLGRYQDVFSKSPALRSYFASNPKELPLANPDELDALSGIDWALEALPASFKAGVDQTALGMATFEQEFGNRTPEIDALVARLSNQQSRTFGNHGGFLTSGLVGLMQSLPGMFESVKGAVEYGPKAAVVGFLAGGAIGSTAGGVGAAPGAVTGAGLGLKVGATYGHTQAQIRLQTGLALNEFRNFKDENGQPLDPDLQRWAALAAGVGGGSLEAMGLSAMVGAIPGMDRVVGALTIPGLKVALKNPGVRTALTSFVKRYANAVTVETFTEGAQEALTILAGELAKTSSGQDFDMLTAEEVTERIAAAGLQGFQVATLLGGATSGTSLGADLVALKRSKKRTDQLERTALALEDNPLLDRAPDLAAKVIDSQADGRSVYIPAEQFVTLYQEQGLDPYGPSLPNWRDRLDGALATGGDVKISVGEFFAYLGRKPSENPIMALARTDPNDYLPAEMQEWIAAQDSLMTSEVVRAQANAQVNYEPSSVFDLIKKAQTDIGYTEEAASHVATMIDSVYQTMGKEAGLTPEQMFERFGPRILAGNAPEGNSNTIVNDNDTADNAPLYQSTEGDPFGGLQAMMAKFKAAYIDPLVGKPDSEIGKLDTDLGEWVPDPMEAFQEAPPVSLEQVPFDPAAPQPFPQTTQELHAEANGMPVWQAPQWVKNQMLDQGLPPASHENTMVYLYPGEKWSLGDYATEGALEEWIAEFKEKAEEQAAANEHAKAFNEGDFYKNEVANYDDTLPHYLDGGDQFQKAYHTLSSGNSVVALNGKAFNGEDDSSAGMLANYMDMYGPEIDAVEDALKTLQADWAAHPPMIWDSVNQHAIDQLAGALDLLETPGVAVVPGWTAGSMKSGTQPSDTFNPLGELDALKMFISEEDFAKANEELLDGSSVVIHNNKVYAHHDEGSASWLAFASNQFGASKEAITAGAADMKNDWEKFPPANVDALTETLNQAIELLQDPTLVIIHGSDAQTKSADLAAAINWVAEEDHQAGVVKHAINTAPVGGTSSTINQPGGNSNAVENFQPLPSMTRGPQPWLAQMKNPIQEFAQGLRKKLSSWQFKDWFQDSVLVDAAGQPLLVFHGGTSSQIEEFNPRRSAYGSIFVTTNPYFSNSWINGKERAQVYPLFARLERPAGEDTKTLQIIYDKLFIEEMKDGLDLKGFAERLNDLPLSDSEAFLSVAIDGDYPSHAYRYLHQMFIELARDNLQETAYFQSYSQAEGLREIFVNAGFDGYMEQEANALNIALFDGGQLKAMANPGTFSTTDKAILAQEARGQIELSKAAQSVITVFQKRDMSTLLHEASHLFLHIQRELAAESPTIAADFEIIKKHLGMTSNEFTRKNHEDFARMGEAFFMEGKAPAPHLVPAFAKFKTWLTFIYKQITKLGGRVHPEISGVFNRMMAVEQKAADLANDQAYRPLFKTAEEMGLDPQDYLDYQNLVETLRSEAVDKTRGRLIGQENRHNKGWMREIQKQLTQEAVELLKSQPPYSHRAVMSQSRFSINKEAFEAKYGKEAKSKFPRSAFKTDGLDPDIAAELLGYPAADDMVYDFVQAQPINEAAKEMAKAEMINRFGEDLNNPELVDLAVKRLMAEDGRVTILAKEYKALAARSGRTVSENGPKQMAKEIARRSLLGKRFRDVDERTTQAAVRRAGALSEAAMLKGDWALAADWKRKQILAQALDNETQALNRKLEKIRDKGAKYTRTAPKSIDPSTMEQIRALVEDFEFTKISKKKLDRRESLAAYVAQAEEEGLVVTIPDYLLRDASKTNYKNLTVEELLGFGDALDNLEHIGRLKHKLRTAKGLREWTALKGEILTSLDLRPTKVKKMKTYTEEQKSLLSKATEFMAGALKPEQIIEWLDSGDISGPMMQHVFQPIAEAQTKQNDMNLQYNEKLARIFDEIDSTYLTSTKTIHSLGTKMSMENIYAVALNMGNDQNRQKLLEGELWTESQVAEILGHLKQEDWDRVQKVWDTIETLWDKIAAMEKRLTGVAPPQVEAREFTNQFGTFRGGYYPVIYDFKAQRGLNLLEDTTPADKRFADGLFSNRFVKPGTSHKHTVARTKVAKPVKLELSVLPGHLHNVIHDLAYREAVRGAYKILWDPEIKASIIGVESENTYNQLTHWLKAVATEHTLEAEPMVQLVTKLRTGATMYGMGYRITTALAQPLGLFTSMTRVGVRNLLPSITHMVRHPRKALDLVNGLSGEMRHRFNTQDRDIKDTVKRLSKNSSKLDVVRHYAFYHIAALDKFAATATWLGAYRQALTEKPNDEARAIQFADRTVRLTQGTGNVKDMAKITNDGELLKLFTMFYSFFSAQYNMQVDLTRKTKRDIAEGDWHTLLSERLPQWTYLVVAPAVFGALLSGQGPEEDESKAAWAARKIITYPTVAVPFLRDVIGAVESGFGYKMSPAAKFLEQSSRALAELFQGDFPNVVKPAITAAAVYFKLPGGQAINTIEGLWEGLTNGDFEPQDAIYGRRDK